MIVKDKSRLTTRCEPTNIKDGEEIAVRLLHELRNSEESGIGLAANQIGINKRVCVINVKEPLVLINPEIVERSEKEFIFPEGCLSFPNKKVRTKRNVSIKVKADNHEEVLSFTPNITTIHLGGDEVWHLGQGERSKIRLEQNGVTKIELYLQLHIYKQ